MTAIQMDILPDEAKQELFNFYDYLVFKYVTAKDRPNATARKRKEALEGFDNLLKLRDRIKPVVDKSVNIDSLINEINNDIF